MRVGNAFGIRIVMNKYFLFLLLACSAFGIWKEVLIAFGTVFLHEFSHALVARNYGVQVMEIELLPFGGVAKTNGLLELDPEIETWVACAGPLSNFFLVLLSYALIELKFLDENNTSFFIQLNALLGAFNCLPVLPLDGGRILRALWSQKIGFRKATERISSFGRYVALILIMIGIWGIIQKTFNVSAIFIAFIIYFSAIRQKDLAMYTVMQQIVRKKELLHKEGAIGAEVLIAQPHTPLRKLLKRTIPKKYLLVWVVDDNGQAIGTVSENEIIQGMLDYGTAITVAGLLQKK